VVRAAELLEGEARLPGIDRHTPSAGIVNFRDSAGNDRILDIVTDPYGMRRREVVEKALRVEYRPGDEEPVHFRVMNPLHCMQSRVHNVVGLHKDDAHGLRQLNASIPCAREFLRMLLSEQSVALDRRRRQVMAWNTAIYRFARSHRNAQPCTETCRSTHSTPSSSTIASASDSRKMATSVGETTSRAVGRALVAPGNIGPKAERIESL
jgi:hypothetical protein